MNEHGAQNGGLPEFDPAESDVRNGLRRLAAAGRFDNLETIMALHDVLEQGDFSEEVIRDALFFRGPWEDEGLDVPRHEVFEATAGAFVDMVKYLEGIRKTDYWAPAEMLLTPDGGQRHEKMGGLWLQDPHDPRSPMAWVQDHVHEQSGLFVPDPEALLHEGRHLSLVQRSAMFIDGLTEDNLENYARIIAEVFRGNEAATEFLRQWLTDEDLHKLGFDVYMHLSQAINPYLLTKQRSLLIREGEMPANGDLFTVIAYVCLQEPATKYSHRATPKSYEVDGQQYRTHMATMLGNIATHEGEHGEAYQRLAELLMQMYPDQMIIAVANAIENFDMPGASVENFDKHKEILAWAGVFDASDFYNIAASLVDRLGIFKYNGPLHPEAELARERLLARLKALQWAAQKSERRREKWRKEHKGEDRMFEDPFAPEGSGITSPVKVSRAKKLRDLPAAA